MNIYLITYENTLKDVCIYFIYFCIWEMYITTLPVYFISGKIIPCKETTQFTCL